MQRFGSYSIRTHEIGKHILNLNWEQVVRLLLIQHADYDIAQKEKKQKLVDMVFNDEVKSMDQASYMVHIDRALDLIESRDRLEKIILKYLKNHPNDY